ncbi:MAG TPA: glycosyltransferase family 2 protein [Patescibacteria group bacterium]|nr:glycosyltransferase family 2 protein [Patescibacteria group bacterium]
MKILVLIPAYNESEKIVEVIRSVKAQSFEVLVVDDGSIDNTSDLAEQAGAKVLVHPINRGQGAAIKTGLTYFLDTGYDGLVFFDADGQMRPEEISQVIEPLLLGKYEVALGSRFLGQVRNIPWVKLVVLKLALLFTRLTTGLKLTDVHNGFQAWSREAIQKLNLTQDRQAYASQVLHEIADKKIKYIETPVTISYTSYSKKKGQSIFNAFNILFDLLIKK